VVNDYLVGQSVPKDLLKTQGFGSVYPVDTNETPEGRARNRRTEVILPQ
jgi:peptidoglycan-binding protein ArfA